MITISAVGDIMLGDHPVRIGQGVRSTLEKTATGDLLGDVTRFREAGCLRYSRWCTPMPVRPRAAGELRVQGCALGHPDPPRCRFYRAERREQPLHAAWRGRIRGERVASETGGYHAARVEGRPGQVAAGHDRREWGAVCSLGYSLRMEEHSQLADLPYCLAEEAAVLEEVRSHANQGAIIVVSLHWGDEYMNYPSLAQIRFAHHLVDSGANVILGHHPHVLQGVETYRDAVIAYSLGNFVFDMWQDATRHGIVLRIEVEQGKVRGFEVTPTFIGEEYRPRPSRDRSRFDRAEALLRAQLERLQLPAAALQACEREYRAAARRKMRRNRLENYGFFIAHLLSYDAGYLRQSLRRSLSRRRAELDQVVRARPSSRDGR